jgi:hypothetical protein
MMVIVIITDLARNQIVMCSKLILFRKLRETAYAWIKFLAESIADIHQLLRTAHDHLWLTCL